MHSALLVIFKTYVFGNRRCDYIIEDRPVGRWIGGGGRGDWRGREREIGETYAGRESIHI